MKYRTASLLIKHQQMFVAMESHSKCGLPSIILSIKVDYFGGSLSLAVLYCDKVLHYGPNLTIPFID